MTIASLLLSVVLAATTPEQLWARIVDPGTPAEERMRAAATAKEVLPPEYIPRRSGVRRQRRLRGPERHG